MALEALKCDLYTEIKVVLFVTPREQIRYISILTILSFSRALTYFPSPGRQRYVHFETLMVDTVERNPSKVDSAWISQPYRGPVYRNENRECYPQQARSSENQFP
jgi:hypothetical protein